MRRRIGVHLGGIVAALRTLISVRLGVSSVSFRELRGRRVATVGVPIRFLTDVIAVFDVYARADRLVGWIELDRRLIADASLEGAVAAVSNALTAGVDRLEFDGIGNVDETFCLGHVSLR